MIASKSGKPINNFFHHYILLPKIFPLINNELHLATYRKPTISSNLIQSKSLKDVFVNVQSENILN